MKSTSKRVFRTAFGTFAAAMLFAAASAFAQDAPAGAPPDNQQQPNQAPPPQQGWQKFSGGWGNQSAPTPDANAPATQAPPAAAQPGAPPAAPAQESYQPPAILTLPSGTYVTVRINQALNSDRNQQGDIFSATLMQPVVINGYVVAQSGQTVYGRVDEAKKAGRVSGVSELKLELTGLTLVDGSNLTIQSQLVDRKGPTSVGRDAAAIGGTTALGAAAGAAADWGRGAAIGAGAGAAVGIIGVLLTRGRPTIVYPESVLTFQLSAPATIDTTHAPAAFQLVQPGDYQEGPPQNARPTLRYGYGPGYPPPPYAYAPAYYPYYPYYYSPFFYGPAFGFFYGPRFFYHGYYGRWYGYRGFRR